MRLYGEIFKSADGTVEFLPKCFIVPNGNGYFQGIKPLRAEVVGERLSVKKYCDGDLEIGGKISSFCVLGS